MVRNSMHPPRLKQKTSRIPLTASAFNNETLHHTALAELFFCWQWVYSYKKRNTNKTLLTCITTEQHFILCFIRTSVQYQHFCRPGKWSLLSGIQAFYREEPCFKAQTQHKPKQGHKLTSTPAKFDAIKVFAITYILLGAASRTTILEHKRNKRECPTH